MINSDPFYTIIGNNRYSGEYGSERGSIKYTITSDDVCFQQEVLGIPYHAHFWVEGKSRLRIDVSTRNPDNPNISVCDLKAGELFRSSMLHFLPNYQLSVIQGRWLEGTSSYNLYSDNKRVLARNMPHSWTARMAVIAGFGHFVKIDNPDFPDYGYKGHPDFTDSENDKELRIVEFYRRPQAEFSLDLVASNQAAWKPILKKHSAFTNQVALFYS
ncbi:MAG: hypothetical protein QY330_04690 [Candidatus Dojkabacteria bacterium]|uniref:Uncharacterized protein n=1 Tax=candidate division WS6 bacterium OLB21 TaxID=1617427 RepID=A0A136KL14_9BACT|nr:MAG: hypothetical protein UZ20_WS6002000079 [candidate division WS6 bacterium OLB21]WKZ27813.1 MAG: hypothetical protein QY330_04690 [Candidatus Dojkabacteria bacterium]